MPDYTYTPGSKEDFDRLYQVSYQQVFRRAWLHGIAIKVAIFHRRMHRLREAR